MSSALIARVEVLASPRSNLNLTLTSPQSKATTLAIIVEKRATRLLFLVSVSISIILPTSISHVTPVSNISIELSRSKDANLFLDIALIEGSCSHHEPATWQILYTNFTITYYIE